MTELETETEDDVDRPFASSLQLEELELISQVAAGRQDLSDRAIEAERQAGFLLLAEILRALEPICWRMVCRGSGFTEIRLDSERKVLLTAVCTTPCPRDPDSISMTRHPTLYTDPRCPGACPLHYDVPLGVGGRSKGLRLDAARSWSSGPFCYTSCLLSDPDEVPSVGREYPFDQLLEALAVRVKKMGRSKTEVKARTLALRLDSCARFLSRGKGE